MNIKILSLLAFFIILVGATSCEDRFEYSFGEIPEGESIVQFDAGFKDFSPALTRSAGNAIEEIGSFYVAVYDADGILYALKSKDVKDDLIDFEYKTLNSVSFKLKMPNGRYRIYAIANIDNLDTYDLSTEDKLHNFHVEWNDKNKKEDGTFDVSPNSQMFGYFESTTSTASESDNTSTDTWGDSRFKAPLVEVGKDSKTTLQAYLYRAASKITFAYDGSGLNDDVTIFIKSVTVKDIPRYCKIGASNTVSAEEEMIENGEKIFYEPYSPENPVPYDDKYTAQISKNKPHFPAVEGSNWKEEAHSSEHADSHSLYFFENIQGIGEYKGQKDENGDGIPDYSGDPTWDKDKKKYGTYIEVDAFHISGDEVGSVKYRFMLGQDTDRDFNAARNYHYKITLGFKGTADNPDWHIEYQKYVFEVSPSKQRLNYQGQHFIPNYSIPNLGHDFSSEFQIEVQCYEEDRTGKRTPKTWTATFEYDGASHATPPDWLSGFNSTPENVVSGGGSAPIETLNVTALKSDSYEFKINDILSSAQAKGTEGAPYDLAQSGETANCYIVDAPGYYIFPIVYGNALKDGNAYEASYKPASADTENSLSHFKNYLNNEITSPFILEDCGVNTNDVSAYIVWQDEPGSFNVWYGGKGAAIDRNAYDGKGGIRFNVSDKIMEGNAVIALKDKDGKVMWSWHIWVTSFGRYDDADKNIQVTAFDRQRYDLMPVNLGWCSNGEPVKYYKEHTCKITFSTTVEDGVTLSKTVEIVKESHIAFPRGNNTYYQWGRKDPFVGTNTIWGNKVRNSAEDGKWWITSHPRRFYTDSSNVVATDDNEKALFPGEERVTTYDIFKDTDKGNILIQYPDIWHNPPRRAIGTVSYVSENRTYSDLWGGNDGNGKTIYDPCPPGYRVPPSNAFSGFTVKGESTTTDVLNYGFDALKKNIMDYTDNLSEFYINTDKLKTIIFPETGYRDYDAAAAVYKFGNDSGEYLNTGIGYSWSRQVQAVSYGSFNSDAAYNLEFSHGDKLYGNDGYIRPANAFYTCDGFPVRPCRQ